jgi:hypothetical protein
MLNHDKVRNRKKKKGWEPTREQFQKMAIRHDTLLKFAIEHADDPTGILSALYHDIVEKYVNVRSELRSLKMDNAELKRMIEILKKALERNSKPVEAGDKW